jgi:nicotinamidase-related amidase
MKLLLQLRLCIISGIYLLTSTCSALALFPEMSMTTATPKLARSLSAAVGKLHPSKTALLLCDVQDRFTSVIWRSQTVIQTCQYMTSVAFALDIPMLATQQYTKVFGETVRECFANDEIQAACPIYEKKLFSMLTPEVQLKVDEYDKESFLLIGIEAHVCVQQTCLDLLEQGKQVHVIVDGVSSQQPVDRDTALQRMRQAGAFVTTAQSAVFMLLQTAEHEKFKQVSRLTVEHMKLSNEFNEALK